ncbi:MAG: ATP-grasp domain-containing protein [Chromatiales bacterium]|nr:ATP-grasp domain-containing protein [Chromatiales bacterium]
MTQGPSVLAPWPAIVAEFPAPPYRSLAADEVEPALRELLSPNLFALVALPLPDGAFETFAGAIAIALQDAAGPSGLAFRSTRSASGQCRVLVGFHEPGAALLALQAGLEAAQALFRRRAGRPVDPAPAAAAIQRSVAAMNRQPDPLARALMRVAKRRRIPVYPAAHGSRVWVYGQGCNAWHFFEAANHGDAMTGSRLARNKQFTNVLITRLGLPGARHAIADSAATAKQLAKSIGYPVVIKPVDSSKGRGVTVRIADEAGIDAAFAAADKLAPAAVLVEGWVAGDDHRLAVVAGRFAWAVRRSPPRVTADGEHTVRELVEAENARRRAAPDRDLAGGRIALDAEAEALIASQGYTLDARPPAGTVVALGLVANQARGGTITGCTDAIHPDNRAMAETIARAFHLDTSGIDFMTPDITRSWRDVPCAVIEINVTPGFSSDSQAELILDRRFPAGANGRVPAVLLVGAGPADLAAVATALAAGGRTVGSTDGNATRMGVEQRFTGNALLPDRAMALVLDPACEAIVVAATPAEIATHGLPLDRFDIALVDADAGLSQATLALLRECCGSVEAGLPPGTFAAAASRLLAATAAGA